MADENKTDTVGVVSPPDHGYPEPNAQEAILFFNIIKNLESNPDINWDGVATDSGFKNAAVAKKRFYQIKNKLGLGLTSPSKPGRKAKTGGDGSPAALPSKMGGNEQNSPSKVTKRRRQSTVKTEKGSLACKTELDQEVNKNVVKTEGGVEGL